MSYTPVSIEVYIAAFSGALAAMSASLRVNSSSTEADYDGASNVAGTFAQSFDTVFNGAHTDTLALDLIEELAYASFQDRGDASRNVSPYNVVSNWNVLSAALSAIVESAEDYFSGQGITPPVANAVPLSRDKFIDSGTTLADEQQNGATSAPYASIANFLTATGTAISGDDANTNIEGNVTPGTYTENPAIPSGRNLELRCDSFPQTLTGNMTCANVTGDFNPTEAILKLHNIALTGTLTMTDDGAFASRLVISGDEASAQQSPLLVGGNIVATGCTNLASISLLNGRVAAIVSTANATGTNLFAKDAAFANFTGLTMGNSGTPIQGCRLTGTAYTLGATGTAVIYSSFFTGSNPVIAGGVSVTMDGPSYHSFLNAGGTITAPMKALVIGGYLSCPVPCASALTNADITVSIDGSGATAGFTAGGNWFVLNAATLSGAHILTLGDGGAKLGDTLKVSRFDTTANTYTIKDSTAATLVVMPVSKMSSALFWFNGVHWQLSDPGNQ